MATSLDERAWECAWRLYEAEAPALLKISRAFVGPDDAEDFVHTFALENLPKISERSRHMEVTGRGAYLRTSFRNFLRNALRSSARHEAALNFLRQETDLVPNEQQLNARDAAFRQEGQRIEGRIEGALEELPKDLSEAAALFLGIRGRAKSIREIARTLQITRYMASQRIIDGVVALALQMQQRGELSPVEVEACRLVLLQGLSLEDASAALGIPSSGVRRALASARASVANSL